MPQLFIILIIVVVVIVAVLVIKTNNVAAKKGVHYQGTAGAGDFWDIVIDHDEKTITYLNNANNSSGTVTYTVNEDGTYDITDPDDNLINAVEIKGYQILINVNKGGSNGTTKTLVIGLIAGPTGVSSTSVKNYNYMQFRTSSGGMEVGYVKMNNGVITHGGYWPYGAMGGSPILNASTADLVSDNATIDPSGNYITVLDNSSEPPSTLTVFGSANGFLSIDMDNGSLVCLQQSEAPDFDPSFAGDYTSLFYGKAEAKTDESNVETGTISLDKCNISVTSGGDVTVTNMTTDEVMFTGTLAPISDDVDIVGEGKVEDDCNGLFRAITGDQSFFITFFDQSILFASMTPLVDNSYNYFYGSGLWNEV